MAVAFGTVLLAVVVALVVAALVSGWDGCSYSNCATVGSP
jgi:hypothetical protein